MSLSGSFVHRQSTETAKQGKTYGSFSFIVCHSFNLSRIKKLSRGSTIILHPQRVWRTWKTFAKKLMSKVPRSEKIDINVTDTSIAYIIIYKQETYMVKTEVVFLTIVPLFFFKSYRYKFWLDGISGFLLSFNWFKIQFLWLCKSTSTRFFISAHKYTRIRCFRVLL